MLWLFLILLVIGTYLSLIECLEGKGGPKHWYDD